jgi:hypothetical protein
VRLSGEQPDLAPAFRPAWRAVCFWRIQAFAAVPTNGRFPQCGQSEPGIIRQIFTAGVTDEKPAAAVGRQPEFPRARPK